MTTEINPIITASPDRLARETRIIRLWDNPPYPWAREKEYYHRPKAQDADGWRLVAYSVDSRGRIIRGWHLNKRDLCRVGDALAPAGPRAGDESIYPTGPLRAREQAHCPREAAWLDSLVPGQPSEPALAHLSSATQRAGSTTSTP